LFLRRTPDHPGSKIPRTNIPQQEPGIMSERRVPPVSPIRGIQPLSEVSVKRTYFRQLNQWRKMSEKYAKERKAREAKEQEK